MMQQYSRDVITMATALVDCRDHCQCCRQQLGNAAAEHLEKS